MTTIDHRILIPAAPDVVWDYVSDITHNPDWQVDCTDVIFLTSRREGPGLRWRYATPGGHEMVIAVTAWYNGLGYEYYFVDGTPFRENKGRIRLQEIPEGTIVQWTFTYELGGLFGGMRNALGMSRQVDQTIAESLKTLWQKIKGTSAAQRTLEPKSLMRDAPDVEARSAYQPRHPSLVDMAEAENPARLAPTRMKVEPPISDEDAQPIRIFDEPPIREDDTRPRSPSPYAPPAASKVAPEAEPDFLAELDMDEAEDASEPDFMDAFDAVEYTPAPQPAEPDFMDEVVDDDFSRFEPPRDASHTQPRKPDVTEVATETNPSVGTPNSTLEIPSLHEEQAALIDDEPEPEPVQAVELPTAPVPELGEETQLELEIDATVPIDEAATQPRMTPVEPEATLTEAPPAPPETEAAPPTGASIWEVFGVPRPSETQEMAQLAAVGDEAEDEDEEEAEPQPAAVEAEPPATKPVAKVEQEIVVEQQLSFADRPAARATAMTLEITPVPSRMGWRSGLRIALRRNAIRLRRP